MAAIIQDECQRQGYVQFGCNAMNKSVRTNCDKKKDEKTVKCVLEIERWHFNRKNYDNWWKLGNKMIWENEKNKIKLNWSFLILHRFFLFLFRRKCDSLLPKKRGRKTKEFPIFTQYFMKIILNFFLYYPE